MPSKNPMRDVRDSMGRFVHESVAALQGVEALPIDVYETLDAVVVKTNIIGIKAEEIDVSITGAKLTIKGESHADVEIEDKAYLRRERRFGKFERSVHIPDDLNMEESTASYKGGVLTITIPKLEQVRPKKVEIQE